MKPDAILCADLHIRDDQPICRTDNYFEAQEKKLRFIFNLAKEHACSIYCAGDFFHKAKSSKWLEIYMMNLIKEYDADIYCIPGNHDLPYHNLEKLNESSLGILSVAGIINVISLVLGEGKFLNISGRYFILMHRYIHEDMFPFISPDHKYLNSPYVSGLLEDIRSNGLRYDGILSGDNHQTFHIKDSTEKILVNPGSMMRMTADQVDHKPCVFLYYIDENEIEQVFLPIEENVINRDHIEKKEEYDKRIQCYVKRMNSDIELSLSYENNLKKYIENNKTRKSVKKIIYECVEE